MPAPPRIRPYKDFLTPAMHRRFAMATTILFGLCFVESIIIGEWNGIFWTFFPIGRAGIRAGLLFISAFSIFVLRVAQLHVGSRTSRSSWQSFERYAPRMQTIQTALWYLFSAWFFSEVFIWSSSDAADVRRIKNIQNTRKQVLNEKAIYLTCYCLFLAVVQSIVHLYYDYDQIEMPIIKTKIQGVSGTMPPLTLSAEQKLWAKLLPMVARAVTTNLAMGILSPFVYCWTIRTFAWSFTRMFAKVVWNLPKSSALPAVWPFHIKLVFRTFGAGFLLTMLWEIGNAAFSIYVGQEPLKNDRPITYESRDPNGSLLTGLKGKKLQTRAFAFWELAYISEHFQGRRKVIYEDIDRKEGRMWSQILDVCLETITAIDVRIAEYNKEPAAKPSTTVKEESVSELPRLGKPLKDGIAKPGDLFNKTSSSSGSSAKAVDLIDSFAKSRGQSSPTPASKVVGKVEGSLLTTKQRGEVAEHGVFALFRDQAAWFINTQCGWPFRQLYRRRLANVVLGSPYAETGVIIDAIDALTRLAVCSLKEDSFGNVQRDVKKIIQTLTSTVTKVEKFMGTIGFHWTDVEKKKESPEVDVVLTVLKDSLSQLIDAFGNYSEDLRLSQSEMRMAREAAEAKA